MIDLNHYSHSNDTLEIILRDRVSSVKKTFRSDLGRAGKSVQKQRKFRPLLAGVARIAAAEVLDFRTFDDRAELLMPYIDGMTGHMFPVLATKDVAQTLSTALSTLLYAELSESRETSVPTSLLIGKMESVIANTGDVVFKELLGRALDYMRLFPAELPYPVGPCHGDLTLSNVIINPFTGIALIDFLDTFLETPLQDIAKLKQDYVYGWSFRKDGPALAVKAEILCRLHMPGAITQIERLYSQQVKLLTLLALARIAPYVRDNRTREWLLLSLNRFMEGEFK